MGTFITSLSQARRHDAYVMEQPPPPQIVAQGTGVAALVAQLPWGPENVLYPVASPKDFLDTFCPAGMARTNKSFLQAAACAWPTLRVVRVVGAAAAVATVAIPTSSTILTLHAKYKGTSGNSITAVVSDASDGDATNHFKLTVNVTDGRLSTTEVYDNLNYSGVGTAKLLDAAAVVNSKLLGASTTGTTGRPANASFTLGATVAGSDGSVSSADYIGTAGAGDIGIAACEGDATIRHVFCDDIGNSDRVATNAALVAHATLMGNRIVYLSGNSGLTLAQTQTARAVTTPHQAVVWCDPWVYVADTLGVLHLIPPTGFAASVAAQSPASRSIAWKASTVQAMLAAIVQLETDRGNGAADNTDAGITTLIREEGGGHTFEAAVVTLAVADATKARLTRTRMGIYVAGAFIKSMRPQVDAPLTPLLSDGILAALDQFMGRLKKNANVDPINLEHVIGYNILPLSGYNDDSTQAAGQLFIPLSFKTSAGAEKIVLLMQWGEGVKISVQ